MYRIRYDLSENRVYINIEGEMSPSESQKYIEEMYRTIEGTSTGFTVFADLSLCAPSVLKNSENFEMVRKYASEYGVSGVVTLVSPQAFEVHRSNPVKGARNIFDSRDAAIKYLELNAGQH
ncbi:MAG: hypothetical protein K0R50_35 [Eubacterium sp.]|jgi:hypothetical protein|nr:hypothetical protein [Eubacterium sp.]